MCTSLYLQYCVNIFLQMMDIVSHFDSSRQSTIAVSLLDNTDMELIIDGKKWNIAASYSARNTINPIRRIVDRCKVLPNLEKPLISLSIGKSQDPQDSFIIYI